MTEPSSTEASTEEIEERFQVLESKVLYQDRTIDDLNEVVTRQQDQMDKLNTEVERLRALLDGVLEGGVEDDDQPPPHY